MALPLSPLHCPMDSLMRLFAGPWTSYIMWVLHQNGPIRFSELKRKMGGVSSKVLTERLRLLEDAGIIFRHYVPTVPPQVTYGITPRGKELGGVLDTLHGISKKWAKEDGKPSCPQLNPEMRRKQA